MKSLGRPITPDEAKAQQVTCIPQVVFDAINSLLIERAGGAANICLKQEEIVKRIVNALDTCTDLSVEERKALHDSTRQRIYDEHWLDVEGAYTEAGWEVEYDKPAYNETYAAVFWFRRKK